MKYIKYAAIRPLALFLALALFAFFRHGRLSYAAETNSGNKPSTTTLPEVVVKGKEEKSKGYKPETLSSTKYTAPLRDIPQSITVVTPQLMKEQNVTTLREALRNVPGISMQAGEGGTPNGDQLSIRGYSARTDIFIDGVRDTGGYTRDPFAVESIEVTKGPTSSYMGRGSTGGAINMISKAPKAEQSFSGTSGWGVIDEYSRQTIDYNQPLDDYGLSNTAFRINGLWHDADVTGRDQVYNERWGFAPSIAFGIDAPTRLTLSYYELNQDNMPDYGIPWVPNTNNALRGYADQPAPVDFDNFYGLVYRDYEKVETELATAVIEHDFSDTLMVRDMVRYGETMRDSIVTAPRFTTNNSSTLIRRTDQKLRDQTSTIMSNTLEFVGEFKTGNYDHKYTAGWEYAHEMDNNFLPTEIGGAPYNTDLFNPNPFDPWNNRVQDTTAKNHAEADTHSLYVFDTMALNENWDLLGGLRWDNFQLNYTPSNSAVISRTDKLVSWRGGAVYKPVEEGSIYFGYGTAFNPSAEGFSLSNTATAATFSDIDPEKSESYEIGTKWDLFEDKLLFTGAYFINDKTNVRTQDPTDPNDVTVLEGEQRVQGFEFGLAGTVQEGWDVFVGYTFLDSEILKSKTRQLLGNEVGNTPENTFSLWTTVDLPYELEYGIGGQFVDDRWNNDTNTRSAPDYWTMDMSLSRPMTENVTLRFNMFNVLDEDYVDSVGGGHVIPGPGRSAILSAEWSY